MLFPMVALTILAVLIAATFGVIYLALALYFRAESR